MILARQRVNKALLKEVVTKLLKFPGSWLRNFKMQSKLIAAFIVLAFLPLLIVGFIAVDQSARGIREKIGAYSFQLVNQVGHNINTNLMRLRSYTDDFIISPDISNRLFGYRDMEPLEQAHVRNFFFLKLHLGFINIDNVDDVMMTFTKDQENMIYDATNVAKQYRWPKEELDRLIKMNEEPDNFANFTVSVTPISGTDGKNVVIGRKIGNIPTLEVLGHLMVAVRQDFFNHIYRDVSIGDESHVFILDSDGVLIAGMTPAGTIGYTLDDQVLLTTIKGGNTAYTEAKASGSRLASNPGEVTRLISEYGGGTFVMDFWDEKQLISWSKIGETNLYAVMTVPYSYLDAETTQLAGQILFSSLGVLLLAMVVSILISKGISAPLRRLSLHMDTFGQGTLQQHIAVDRGDEVGHLQNSFNRMTSAIVELLEKNSEENRIRRIIELRVLEYQVNPHFLYNSLDSLNWMAQKVGQPEISAMVTALARFYRLSLSKGQELYSVQKEIEHIRNFLIIYKIRYKDSFEYEFDVEPGILNYKIIRIILQPLVENAVKYGVVKHLHNGRVRIEGRKQGDQLIFSVCDNGRGIPKNKLEELSYALAKLEDDWTEESGFGLLNVHRRILLTYGPPYGLKVYNGKDGGAVSEIVIPAENV